MLEYVSACATTSARRQIAPAHHGSRWSCFCCDLAAALLWHWEHFSIFCLSTALFSLLIHVSTSSGHSCTNLSESNNRMSNQDQFHYKTSPQISTLFFTKRTVRKILSKTLKLKHFTLRKWTNTKPKSVLNNSILLSYHTPKLKSLLVLE